MQLAVLSGTGLANAFLAAKALPRNDLRIKQLQAFSKQKPTMRAAINEAVERQAAKDLPVDSPVGAEASLEGRRIRMTTVGMGERHEHQGSEGHRKWWVKQEKEKKIE
jgi:hypothetical protein